MQKILVRLLLLILLTFCSVCGAWAQQGGVPANYKAKLAPGLQKNTARKTAAPPATYRISTSDEAALRAWMKHELLAKVMRQIQSGVVQLTLTADELMQLLPCPAVSFVDVAQRPAYEERELPDADFSVNTVTAVHQRYPTLAGQGLTVSVKERPFDPTDIDFRGRLAPSIPAENPDFSEHASVMATLIAGGGNSGPTSRGVAWQARLATSSFAELLPDDGAELAQAGVSVQNHSYGTGIENYYGVETRAYDEQVQAYPTLLHVFSSGNSGNQTSAAGYYENLPSVANLTGQFKMSKNTLSVGATTVDRQVALLSSRGPAYDGRVKPELVALGAGGTSEAAAVVSGVALLVQQAYRNQQGHLPSAALVKAVLLNSADDIAAPAVDFVSGYGQVDALGAVQTITERHFREESVGDGQLRTFRLMVPAGSTQLRATLAWTDPAAAINAERALRHDLDLELVNLATGQHWLPWVLSAYPHPDSLALPARRGPDHLNNAEQISLVLPPPGEYELRVRGYQVPAGPQAFSVAYEFGDAFQWLQPVADQPLLAANVTNLRWQWSGAPTTARLEYRLGDGPWQLISTNVALAQRTFRWTVPATAALWQVRLTTSAATYLAEPVVVARAPTLSVGYTCASGTLLYWPRQPGVTQYQLYQLGATALEPVQVVADTAVLLSATTQVYYAVAPIVQNRPGPRSLTIDYTQQGVGCYVQSFVPRQLVADTVAFDLQLGSVFRLRSIMLERLAGEKYVGVQTLMPVTQRQLLLTDHPSQAGRYYYRTRLETTTGQVYYSQSEEIYFAPSAAVLVFPNPVAAGEPLHLIEPSGAPLHLQLYDLSGRLVRETNEQGSVIGFATVGLRKGVYLLRVQVGGLPTATHRIIVL